jgi:hypothetical protein
VRAPVEFQCRQDRAQAREDEQSDRHGDRQEEDGLKEDDAEHVEVDVPRFVDTLRDCGGGQQDRYRQE